MITITEVLDNKTCPTMVLDISEDSISVNCPENSGIEVEAVNRGSHFELIFKLPHIDKNLRFQGDNDHMSNVVNEVEFGAAFGFSSATYLAQ